MKILLIYSCKKMWAETEEGDFSEERISLRKRWIGNWESQGTPCVIRAMMCRYIKKDLPGRLYWVLMFWKDSKPLSSKISPRVFTLLRVPCRQWNRVLSDKRLLLKISKCLCHIVYNFQHPSMWRGGGLQWGQNELHVVNVNEFTSETHEKRNPRKTRCFSLYG